MRLVGRSQGVLLLLRRCQLLHRQGVRSLEQLEGQNTNTARYSRTKSILWVPFKAIPLHRVYFHKYRRFAVKGNVSKGTEKIKQAPLKSIARDNPFAKEKCVFLKCS